MESNSKNVSEPMNHKPSKTERDAFRKEADKYFPSDHPSSNNSMEIDNTPEASVKSGNWKNPGKKLYDEIAYKSNREALGKEAYLEFPSDAFKSWPRASGYSRCKYPHHVIRDGKLVVDIKGLQAAFQRCKQMGLYSGNKKTHINRHYKELGLVSDAIQESVVFSKPDYLRNMGKWEENSKENLLFITGLSGSGKSTIAKQYAKEHNAWIINMDAWDCNYIFFEDDSVEWTDGKKVSDKKSDLGDQLIIEYFNDHPDIKGHYLMTIIDKDYNAYKKEIFPFIRWLKETCVTRYPDQLFIVEGLQLFEGVTPEYLLDRPVIIMGTSVIQSLCREMKRDNFNFLADVKEGIRKFQLWMRDEKQIKKIRQKLQDADKYGLVKESSDLDLTYIETMDFSYMSELMHEPEHVDEKLVPVFGICRSYTMDKIRNDGTEKSFGELQGIKFKKIVSLLTRGDQYSHSLISLDPSMREMYSYEGLEGAGFVTDSIEDVESWLGTESIYISCMFLTPDEYVGVKQYIEYMKTHASETIYARSNILTAYVGKPTKMDKRFMCSSFVAYVLAMSNPKNIHRDYSRLRPEDVTILPRAFYVMNVKDRAEFTQRKNEIPMIVNHIYEEHKEELMDYNNHLPKIILSEKMGKLKTFDKIFDWICSRLGM
jgi:uridine kinase